MKNHAKGYFCELFCISNSSGKNRNMVLYNIRRNIRIAKERRPDNASIGTERYHTKA